MFKLFKKNASSQPAPKAVPKPGGICQFYNGGNCVAGGETNRCSANPQDPSQCFVYKYNMTGDLSVLYGSNTRIVG